MNINTTVKMRRCFVDILHTKMVENSDIWVVTGDLGYKMWGRGQYTPGSKLT